MINLQFDRKLFTPVFWQLREMKARIIVCRGGASSGKSYAMADNILIRCLQSKEKVAVFRKVGESIKDSTRPLFIEKRIPFFEKCGIKDFSRHWKFRAAENKLVNVVNGSQILFRGLDEREKLKSFEGMTYAWCEEATEFDFNDILEINRRPRNVPNFQLVLTFNPVDRSHWIKTQLLEGAERSGLDSIVEINSTYRDNPFLDEQTITELERLKHFSENQYNIYALNVWGSDTTGWEFYTSFNYSRHVTKVEPLENYPVFISFDQNVVPYITATLYQVVRSGDRYLIRQFGELCLENPRNKTEALCYEIIQRYERYMVNGVDFFGDASGRRRDTRGTETDYDIVQRMLARFLRSNSNRVTRSNPRLSKRRDFIDRLMSGYFNIDYICDENCKHTIADFMNIKVGPDRQKVKETTRDKSGVSYEKYGHASDSFDYFVCENFKGYML